MVKEEARALTTEKKAEIFQKKIPRKGLIEWIIYFILRRNVIKKTKREEKKKKRTKKIGDVFSAFLILNLIFPLECVISIRFEY